MEKQLEIDLSSNATQKFDLEIGWTSSVLEDADIITVEIDSKLKSIIKKASFFLKQNYDVNYMTTRHVFDIYLSHNGKSHEDNPRCDVMKCFIGTDGIYFFCSSKWDSSVQYESDSLSFFTEEWGLN